MGRPRKPTGKHIADGTLNVTRHAGRMREPQFTGEPEKPKGMSQESQQHWDKVIPELCRSGAAKTIDTAWLQAMCEAWSEYRSFLRMRPTKFDEKIRRQRMVISCRRSWVEMAAKVGLNPADRARLEIEAGGDEANPLEQMLLDQPVLKIAE